MMFSVLLRISQSPKSCTKGKDTGVNPESVLAIVFTINSSPPFLKYIALLVYHLLYYLSIIYIILHVRL